MTPNHGPQDRSLPGNGPFPDNDGAPAATPLLASFPPGSEADRILRQSLAVLRDSASNERAAARFDSVLRCEASLRDVALTPEFDAAASAGLRHYERQVESMSPEERLAFEAEADQRGSNWAEPGSREDL